MIHVICLGNRLHADDGFGAAMAHRLGLMAWPAGIRVIDATSKGNALAHFQGCRRAIVLDVFAPEHGAPGQVLRLDARDYPAQAQGALAGGTATLLAAIARTMDPVPEIEVWGPVASLKIPFSPGLSPLTAAAVETVAAMLARELGGCNRRRPRAAMRPLLSIF